MKYAKLLDGKPVFAPNPILHDDVRVGNPPIFIYEEKGYKPLVYTPQPDVEGGEYYIVTWNETENEIIQGWEKVEGDNILEGDEIDE